MSVQLIPIDKRKGRRFSPQQKLQILKEWEQTGNGVAVAKKHQIHPQTLYRWKKAMDRGAEIFLGSKCPKVDPRIKQLERENQHLKEALTIQTQELMLLKKRMNLV
jgi:transposase-like protein